MVCCDVKVISTKFTEGLRNWLGEGKNYWEERGQDEVNSRIPEVGDQ